MAIWEESDALFVLPHFLFFSLGCSGAIERLSGSVVDF